MVLLLALCVVGVVSARVVFPREIREELHEEMEELKELGHSKNQEPKPEEPDEQAPEHKEDVYKRQDYDPSATRVNQENRIKLMLAVARERLPKAVPVEETQQEATGREKLRRAEKTPA